MLRRLSASPLFTLARYLLLSRSCQSCMRQLTCLRVHLHHCSPFVQRERASARARVWSLSQCSLPATITQKRSVNACLVSEGNESTNTILSSSCAGYSPNVPCLASKDAVPKTLAFAFGSRLRSKTQRSKAPKAR